MNTTKKNNTLEIIFYSLFCISAGGFCPSQLGEQVQSFQVYYKNLLYTYGACSAACDIRLFTLYAFSWNWRIFFKYLSALQPFCTRISPLVPFSNAKIALYFFTALKYNALIKYSAYEKGKTIKLPGAEFKVEISDLDYTSSIKEFLVVIAGPLTYFLSEVLIEDDS